MKSGWMLNEWLRYRIAEWLVRGIEAIFPLLPCSVHSALNRAVAEARYVFLRKQRKWMEDKLAVVMSERFPTAAERRALLRRAWMDLAQVSYETAQITWNASKESICSGVVVEGEEDLRGALDRKKGVIALSAHLGNFSLIGARLAAAGYPFSVLVKQPPDQSFARLMDYYRARIGIKTISARPRREAVHMIVQSLRGNEIVLMMADQSESGGVELQFLGQPLVAPRSPATLALRTGASVLPMFLTRNPESNLILRIGSRMEFIETGDLQKDVRFNIELFSRLVENEVRRYPEQWIWHNSDPTVLLGLGRDQGLEPSSGQLKEEGMDRSRIGRKRLIGSSS